MLHPIDKLLDTIHSMNQITLKLVSIKHNVILISNKDGQISKFLLYGCKSIYIFIYI